MQTIRVAEPVGLLDLPFLLFAGVVGQSGHDIDTNMGPYPRSRCLVLFLVKGADVDDSVFSHEQHLLGQTGVDFLEDPLGQEVIR
ncbi:hypothetical protein HMEPL2_21770 [Vreelandella aquamarina]|uniref:Uncharacterized protein n=1 Tax=Vreelandella aquamarina TaxID=77097 RepID=A0A6F8XC60_9GAMM|nr:hypothetical protein HMEPL2_21770 [Halomonas meridiana]